MHDGRVDCEFTLALNNRTGKYFFCRDLMAATPELVHDCYYWRWPFGRTPSGLFARILGRLALIEVETRIRYPVSYRILPAMKRDRPVVFMDPRECVLYELKRSDVVICHDMGPLTHPALYGRGVKKLYERAYARVEAAKPSMLFVSDASRQAFAELYGTDYPAMDLVQPPLRAGIDDGPEEVVPGIPEKFLLTVGSIGTRKNQLRAIRAFERLGLAERGFAYVVCGGPEPGAEDVVAKARNTAGVVLPGYVSDNQLRWLYRNAQGFVLPSLLEGFGLPAAEAIVHGLIPLVGAGGALHEVTGDEAILVDPEDDASIETGMLRLAEMPDEERARRLPALRASIARFSMEQATAAWRSAIVRATGMAS